MSGMLTGWISWKAAFYFYGVMGMFWYASWLWLSFEKPRVHPAITIKELKYIEKSLGESNPVTGLTSFKAIIQSTPWKAFFTSMPVYAIIVANFCRSWNFYLLVLYQSAYLKQTFNFKIQSTGLVGALPHLLMTMIVPYGGILADYLRKNKILSTTMVRKVFNCGGYGLEGIFFLVVAHATTAVSDEGRVVFVVQGINDRVLCSFSAWCHHCTFFWRGCQCIRRVGIQCQPPGHCTEVREYSDGIVERNRNNCRTHLSRSH